MSSSDHCTAAYGSQGSSAKTLSVTLADHAQSVEQSSSGVDAAGIPSAAEPRLAGASATATPYGNGQLTEEEEEALFLNDEGQHTPPPLPPPLSSSPRAVPAPVVDRREISAADISSMRWEGCRTHRLTPSSSTHASVYGGTQASTPFSVALPRTSRATSGHYVDPQDGGDSGAAVSVATAASLHRRSSAASPGATTLDTSIAILQHMASDTAARVSGQRPFLSPLAQSTTPTPTAASPAAPLSTQLRTAVPPAPAVAQAVPEQETDPIGLHLDSEPDGGVSQPHTGSTRQYVRSATPGSSLHSLSDSELCAGQVRGLGTSRNVSAQALSRLGEETAAEGGEWRAGEPPGQAKRRLHLVAVPSCNQVAGQSCPAAGGGASAASVPFSSTSLAAGQAALDASVYNHDFQRIISHEVKEALTRNMRPSAEEDDEDEDDTLLNDVLSAQASPGTVSVKRHGSTVGLGESRNSAFAPFQLPMAATSLGRLDSIVGLPPCGAGARAAQQPLSLSTAALEETSPTLTMGGGTGIATTTSSAATSGGSKGVSPQLVSAQAWRFPTLGVDAATPSSAAPRRPSSGSHDEEGKAATAKTAAGEAADTSPHVPAASQQPPSEAATPTTTPTGQHSSGGGGGSAAVDAGGDGLRGGPAPMAATAGWVAPFSPTPPPPPSPSPAGPQGGGVVAMLALGTAVPEERSAPAAPSAVRSDSGGGAATVVRVEDGRLYTRPFISITSSSSLPGSGNMPDESFARKLDMVHTVYERLARQERHAATPKAVKTLLLRKPTAPAAAPQAFTVTPQLGSGGAVAAGQTPGTGLGSRARRSPSLSCSGALGRSAGYYSFGTRVSLSHPNRQSLPLQYLGSSSNLAHGTPSPGTTVLGSPAVMDLVAGGGHGGPPVALALCSNAPENSLTHRSVSAARVARRGLDSGILRRIEARPLLQSTLFLQHVLYTIREAHGCAARLAEKARGSTAATATTLASPADLSRHTDSAAANAVVPSAGADRLASMATPLGSVANVTTDSQELSSGRTRGPSSGSSRSSFVDRAATAAAAAAGGRAGTVGSSAPGGERRGRPSVHADRSSSGSRTTGDSPQSYNASRTQPAASAEATEDPPAGDVAPGAAQPSLLMKAEDAGGAAQRYYRALTEAEHRVRHVHGVDGVEREVDNESLDLIVYVGMRLLGWLEVVSLLGCGSFGQVFLCKDLRICDGHYVHPSEIAGVDYEYWNCSHAFLPFSSVDVPPTNPPLVAVKVVKSVPLLEQQSVLEAEMLVLIGAQTAASADEADAGAAPPPEDPRCASVAKVLADGICYGHHCIVMERYGANLYEYIASKEHSGLPMYQIRSIGRQLFSALSLIHEECHIIHADIKPENMLLTLDSSRGVVRTSDAAVAQVAKATATTAAARECSPPAVPPRHAQRTEGSVSASTSCSPERSYITLRSGPTAAAAGGRQRQHSRRSSALPQELSSSSAVGRAKGQSFYHLRSSISSGLTMVEQSSIPAPEPRRVHALTQPAGMISARAAASSMTPADPLPPPSMVPRLHVKLIDFSSSCYDGGPFYQYIQSRYYRAPEVIVGASYSAGIDIWSSGCMLAELLLGMPLLPGCNDHHQLCLIEEMVGPLPTQLITEGLNTELYYTQGQAGDAAAAGQGGAGAQAPPSLAPPRPYTLRSREDYLRITQSEPQPYRRYFTYQTLQELVRHCPLTLEERRMSNGLQPYVAASESSEIPPNATPSPSVRAEMMKQRFLLFDLLRKLLQTDAAQRPTASQALTHPFFTSAPPYMKTFKLE